MRKRSAAIGLLILSACGAPRAAPIEPSRAPTRARAEAEVPRELEPPAEAPSPLDPASLHVVLEVHGVPRCVALHRQRDAYQLAGTHGRYGWIRATIEADRIVVRGAGGTGANEAMSVGGEGGDEVYRFDGDPSGGAIRTDRGTFFVEPSACTSAAPPLELGRFASLVAWLFPSPGPDDRLARAMRAGRTIHRSETCAAWRFVPGEHGLEGELVRRAGASVHRQSYRYDPTVGALSLTDETVSTRHPDGTVDALASGGFAVVSVSDEGGPSVDVAGERWFFSRRACARGSSEIP